MVVNSQEKPDLQVLSKEPQPGLASLFLKMSRVMGNLQRIDKGGFNTHFKYRFATAEDVADAIRKEMAAQGLALLVEMTGYTVEERKTSTGITNLYTVHFRFTIGCGETGAYVTMPWIATAFDGQDKGPQKAATAAEKYFLMKIFCLSSGDEADADADSPLSDNQQRDHDSRRLPQKSGSPGRAPYLQDNTDWHKDQSNIDLFAARIMRSFNLTPEQALEKLDKPDWGQYSTGMSAYNALYDLATEGLIPMVAESALYYRTPKAIPIALMAAGGKTEVFFNDGPSELAVLIDLEDWQNEILSWKPDTDRKKAKENLRALPFPVLVTAMRTKDRKFLNVAKIEPLHVSGEPDGAEETETSSQSELPGSGWELARLEQLALGETQNRERADALMATFHKKFSYLYIEDGIVIGEEWAKIEAWAKGVLAQFVSSD